MWNYRAKWKFIGIELGIDIGTLEAVDANHKNVEDCLREMINGWLKNVNPRPTRGAIKAALQSDCVNIPGKYCLNNDMVSQLCNHTYEQEHSSWYA